MSPLVAAIIFFAVYIIVFTIFGIKLGLRPRQPFKMKRYLVNGQPKSAKCDTLVQAKCVYFTDIDKNKSDSERQRRTAVYEVTYAGETYEVNDRNARLHKNSEIGTIREAYINPKNKEEIYIDYGPEEFTKTQKIIFYALLAFVAVGLVATVISLSSISFK